MGVDLSFLYDESMLGLLDKYIASQDEESRNYLGMSEIGDCARKLWFKYHKGAIDKPIPRMKRLLDMGKIIEARIIKEMKSADIKVTGRQKTFKDFKGKFKGHCDGIIEGIPESSKPHILEIKSCNDKNFALVKKKGIQAHYPKYYDQAQCYMGYAKLQRCMFIIENKNDSARYQERIRFDKEHFEKLKAKAAMILDSKYPPSGINDWKCNYCHCNTPSLCMAKDGRPF